jgi:protein-S-isoprenylcysteine O-methyltransferase Ste14
MAILLSTSFILFAVIGRMIVQFYYTRDHGLRFLKASSPLADIFATTSFVISFVVSIVLIWLETTGIFVLDIILPNYIRYFAAAISAIGIGIVLLAQIQMGRSWRIGVDHEEKTSLIQTGLYKYSRNPIYLGIFLYWIGMVLIFASMSMLFCGLICCISIDYIVRKIEEPYLVKTHGVDYNNYMKTTHRYLGNTFFQS